MSYGKDDSADARTDDCRAVALLLSVSVPLGSLPFFRRLGATRRAQPAEKEASWERVRLSQTRTAYLLTMRR